MKKTLKAFAFFMCVMILFFCVSSCSKKEEMQEIWGGIIKNVLGSSPHGQEDEIENFFETYGNENGFNEVIGSWNTVAIFLPLIFIHSLSVLYLEIS